MVSTPAARRVPNATILPVGQSDRRAGGTVALRATARRAVKLAAEAWDATHSHDRGVVILIYHRVGRRTSMEIDLPASLFEEQIQLLAASGRASTLDAALCALGAPEPPPVDPVVVTFDGGTLDFAEIALPILERHRVPATLYVATHFIENEERFPSGDRPLSWAALYDALATGLVQVGTYMRDYRVPDWSNVAAVAADLDCSIGLMAEHLSVMSRHAAYTGAYVGSSAVAAAVRERFSSAAVTGTRPNRYGRTDPYRLARSPIQLSDGMRFFRQKVAGGMALEDEVRRLLSRGVPSSGRSNVKS